MPARPSRPHALGMRRGLGVVFALLMVLSMPSATGVARPAVSDPPLDLALIALRPADLDPAGLKEYGIGNGLITTGPDAAGEFLRAWRGDPERATGDAFGRAAPRRIALLNLTRPGTEGNAYSGTRGRVVSAVLEFTDDRAAQAGFSTLAAAWQTGAMRRDASNSGVGTERIQVNGAGREETGYRASYQHRDLMFRTGRLVAGASVEQNTRPQAASEVVEDLAARLSDRIEQVATRGGPGLDGQVLRLQVPGQNAITDAYVVLAGEPLREFDETAAAFEKRRGRVIEAGITDQYLVEQQATGAIGATDGLITIYSAGVITFKDEGAASEYLAASSDRLTRNGADDVQAAAPPAMGDEVASYTYRHRRADGIPFEDYRIYVRVASTTISIAVNATESFEPRTVDELAAQQVACGQGAGCAPPVPPELRGHSPRSG